MAEPNSRLASEQEARDVAEDAREQEWEKRSFARALFAGTLDLGLLWPPPEPGRLQLIYLVPQASPLLER